jgi:hypothetical protein
MRRFVMIMALIVGMLFAALVFQGLDQGGGSMPYQPQPVRNIAFRDVVLDGQALAKQQARVEIVGLYQGLSAEF